MPSATMNMPLYRVLRSLNVADKEAEAAAETFPASPMPDISHLATRDELRAEIAGVRADLRTEIAGVRTEIAQTAQRQTLWLVTAIFAAAGLVIAISRLLPPH